MSAIALLLLGALLPGGDPAADDIVPDTLDTLLANPEDLIVFGIAQAAPGDVRFFENDSDTGRCLAALDDLNDDDVAEFALGFSPGSASTLQVRDGDTGAVLWSATPDGGGFRTLSGLAASPGRLAYGVSSPSGRVGSRDPATGAVHWTRDLAVPDPQAVANVLGLAWTTHGHGDADADLLVCGGRGIDALLLLSGADGTTLWTHPAGDSVNAAVETIDLDDDKVPDILAAGGDDAPFVRALSGADGTLIWEHLPPGPASTVLTIGDTTDDGIPEVAVGLFAEPGSCVTLLDGADGSWIWNADFMPRNVTALARGADLDGDGASDVVAGSLSNSVSCFLSDSGLTQWRKEGSTVNTGAMLSVTAVGDLDGNGGIEILTASQDHRAYLLDGANGFVMALQNTRSRGIATVALPDADGDGRAEMVVASRSSLMGLGGGSGTADGPIVILNDPGTIHAETGVLVFALPGTQMIVMGALGTGDLAVPGFEGSFGLDFATLGFLHIGPTPAAGGQGFVVAPLPREFLGLTIHYQAASIYEPGFGYFSNVVDQPLVE